MLHFWGVPRQTMNVARTPAPQQLTAVRPGCFFHLAFMMSASSPKSRRPAVVPPKSAGPLTDGRLLDAAGGIGPSAAFRILEQPNRSVLRPSIPEWGFRADYDRRRQCRSRYASRRVVDDILSRCRLLHWDSARSNYGPSPTHPGCRRLLNVSSALQVVSVAQKTIFRLELSANVSFSRSVEKENRNEKAKLGIESGNLAVVCCGCWARVPSLSPSR